MKTFRPTPTQAQPLNVTAGEAFAIELESVPTAGYEWTLAPVPGLRVVPTGWTSQAQGGNLGGSTMQRFEIVAERAGEFAIQCVYKRSWESAEENRRTVRVVVRPPAAKRS